MPWHRAEDSLQEVVRSYLFGKQKILENWKVNHVTGSSQESMPLTWEQKATWSQQGPCQVLWHVMSCSSLQSLDMELAKPMQSHCHAAWGRTAVPHAWLIAGHLQKIKKNMVIHFPLHYVLCIVWLNQQLIVRVSVRKKIKKRGNWANQEWNEKFQNSSFCIFPYYMYIEELLHSEQIPCV